LSSQSTFLDGPVQVLTAYIPTPFYFRS
jgi:hypothetical protein